MINRYFCSGIIFSLLFLTRAEAASLDVSPTIDITQTQFVLGERIPLKLEIHTPTDVDGLELASTDCKLMVTRPDGGKIVKKEGGAPIYDGPSKLSSLYHTALLNDIDPQLIVGTYNLSYQCGKKKSIAIINLQDFLSLKDVHVTLQFPDHILLSKDKTFLVKVVISNESATPIRIVAPHSNYEADGIAYLDYADGWTRFNSTSATLNTPASYRIAINSANLDKLNLETISSHQSYTAELNFRSAIGNGPLGDAPDLLPKSKFEIVSGLVLPIIFPADIVPQGIKQPIKLLVRSKACYNWEWN